MVPAQQPHKPTAVTWYRLILYLWGMTREERYNPDKTRRYEVAHQRTLRCRSFITTFLRFLGT